MSKVEPSHVWLAINLYPESMDVLVASTRDGALDQIRRAIPLDEWDDFQAAINRNCEPGGDLAHQDATDDVVQHYFGPYEPAADHGENAVYVGEEWLVRPSNVYRIEGAA